MIQDYVDLFGWRLLENKPNSKPIALDSRSFGLAQDKLHGNDGGGAESFAGRNGASHWGGAWLRDGIFFVLPTVIFGHYESETI
jgi:hypothetical protein